MLWLLCRTFVTHTMIVKKKLYVYLSLLIIRSQLTYCLQIWWPFYVKIFYLSRRFREERLNIYLMTIILHINHVWYNSNFYPLAGICVYLILMIYFFIKSYKSPSHHFDINKYISFSHSSTRSSNNKLTHIKSTCNLVLQFYFCRLPCLWNALPYSYINLNSPFNKIKDQIFGYFWKHFIDHFVDDYGYLYFSTYLSL